MEVLIPKRLFRIRYKKYLSVPAYISDNQICLQCALKGTKDCLNDACIETIGLQNVLKEFVEVEKLDSITNWKIVCRR